ncbi:MAG: ribonuclease E/G [Lachnospiraceae bacterium]|nr:ribonuclease E/G [Lachnospiraceae bacterium]
MDKKCIVLKKVLKKQTKILTLFFHGKQLVKASVEEETGRLLGRIYLAKVKDIVKNIQAAFVEIQPGVRCFLSLQDIYAPFLLNRTYDGRLLVGDELLVQVKKEAMGTKPPSVTCQLALDGKYGVLSLGKPGIAYSSRLSAKVKTRIGTGLANYPLQQLQSYGIVIRTNAKELAEDITPLWEELCELAQRMEELQKAASFRTCFSLLHEKLPTYLTALRDLQAEDYSEIITDNLDIFRKIEDFSQKHPQFGLPALRLYEDSLLPLEQLYGIRHRLQEALNRQVWLKSGGYLMIEPTEALTVIDVNSGKIGTKKKPQETYVKVNHEAAEEIARQLTLRNLSGIIIIDFISMEQEEERRKLLAYFGDLLKKDRIRTQLVGMTTLGLVEVTRMKISSPLWEQLEGWNADIS